MLVMRSAWGRRLWLSADAVAFVQTLVQVLEQILLAAQLQTHSGFHQAEHPGVLQITITYKHLLIDLILPSSA